MHEMNSTGIVWCSSIPSDWEMRRVKDCFYISKVKAGTKDPVVLKLARSGVQVKDVTVNGGQMAESYDDYNPVQVGDLLLNPMDLYSGANCNVSEVEGVISPAYVNLRAKETLNPYYFDYYFKIQYWTMAMFAHGKGVSYDNRWTINAESVKAYELPFPSVSEQNAIVDIIKRKSAHIDALIANAQQQIEKLKAYKQSVITETVTKGLDPDVQMKDSGVEWIGEIPEHWEIAKIKIGVTKVGSGKTPLGGAETYSTEGVLFLRSQNIYDEGINLDSPTYITENIDEEMKGTRVRPYDVLLNITGGSIGRCCIFPPELERANVNQHVSIIRVIDRIFTPDYMHYYWNSNIGKMSISLYQTGGNREGMSADAIKNSPIMVIPIQEQKAITTYLDRKCSQIDKLIAIKQQKIEKLQQYKKSLIYEYVTGKKEV